MLALANFRRTFGCDVKSDSSSEKTMCVLLALAWQRQGWRSCFIGGEAKRRASQVSWHTASAWADNDIRGHVGATIDPHPNNFNI